MSHRLRGMAVGRLRLSFGLEHKCYPSVLTGLKVETKAIWHRLDFINLNLTWVSDENSTARNPYVDWK